MKNHKKEYKYNYEELVRELSYTTASLGLILDDIDENPRKLVERIINDIKKKVAETTDNLKPYANSPQETKS